MVGVSMLKYELGYDYHKWCFGSIRGYFRKGKRIFELFDNENEAEKRKKELTERNKMNKDVYCNFIIKPVIKSSIAGKTQYIPFKDTFKEEIELHEIARNIKMEDDNLLFRENATKEDFYKDIKSEIEWYFSMVHPPVTFDILEENYNRLLKLESRYL